MKLNIIHTVPSIADSYVAVVRRDGGGGFAQHMDSLRDALATAYAPHLTSDQVRSVFSRARVAAILDRVEHDMPAGDISYWLNHVEENFAAMVSDAS